MVQSINLVVIRSQIAEEKERGCVCVCGGGGGLFELRNIQLFKDEANETSTKCLSKLLYKCNNKA